MADPGVLDNHNIQQEMRLPRLSLILRLSYQFHSQSQLGRVPSNRHDQIRHASSDIIQIITAPAPGGRRHITFSSLNTPGLHHPTSVLWLKDPAFSLFCNDATERSR